MPRWYRLAPSDIWIPPGVVSFRPFFAHVGGIVAGDSVQSPIMWTEWWDNSGDGIARRDECTEAGRDRTPASRTTETPNRCQHPSAPVGKRGPRRPARADGNGNCDLLPIRCFGRRLISHRRCRAESACVRSRDRGSEVRGDRPVRLSDPCCSGRRARGDTSPSWNSWQGGKRLRHQDGLGSVRPNTSGSGDNPGAARTATARAIATARTCRSPGGGTDTNHRTR